MSRVQLVLNVDDLDASIDFYSRLFATEPNKIRPGYANFAIPEPPPERDTTCCYARQDKFWVEGAPDEERWEIYTVLAGSPVAGGPAGASGCDCAISTEESAGAADPRAAGSAAACC